jgi:anti-sigma-K factor RskA
MALTMTDTRPTFSRLTEGKATQSWRSAVPAVIVVVAFVALLAYLASALSSAEQKGMAAQREANDTRQQSEGLTRQIAALQKDDALLRSPGRTTVILQASDKKEKSWAAVTWGEFPSGKSFMRVNGYGLEDKLEGGKTYHAWFVPQTGNAVDLGELSPDANASGFTMASDLPPVDQGKTVELTLDAAGAKEPGDVVAKADLPKLSASKVVEALPSDQPQAKSGSTSQQMHQQSLGK